MDALNQQQQQPSLHCQLCHYKLDLHPSLIDGDNVHPNDPILSEFDVLESIARCSNTPLQLPMCKICSSKVSTELQKQLNDLETECISYKSALDQLVAKRAETAFDNNTAKHKLQALQKEEDELLEQFAALETEEKILNQELDNKLEERKLVTEKDTQLYRQLRDNHRTLIELSEENRSLKAQAKFTNEQIQRLTRVNVLDMAFFIWKDGDYMTINGFRLGRLRQELVEWNEINAAFGQIAFLLVVMAEKLNMKFSGYEVFPCASHSFIRAQRAAGKIEDLPLYGSGGWRPFGQPALDQALVAYLECFCQLETRLKAKYPSATQILPYRMIKDKIVDKDSQYLIKMQLNSEERWTKAMKCLLINLKRVVGILGNIRTASTSAPHQQKMLHQGQAFPPTESPPISSADSSSR
uniref:Uncharacterized protein n=1 Tax=Ditylenchus dipsaci TaxID=166011 RepID=A0A915CPZ7_9BILA